MARVRSQELWPGHRARQEEVAFRATRTISGGKTILAALNKGRVVGKCGRDGNRPGPQVEMAGFRGTMGVRVPASATPLARDSGLPAKDEGAST